MGLKVVRRTVSQSLYAFWQLDSRSIYLLL